MAEWQNLKNPPVVTTVFQLKYNLEDTEVKLDDFLQYNNSLSRDFPSRRDDLETNITFPKSTKIPLGRSLVSGETNTHRVGYAYISHDNKEQLRITNKDVTFTSERDYEGWEKFMESVMKYIMILEPILSKLNISRTSIRYINQFQFVEFNDPSQYVKTLITTSENGSLPYPLLKYGFKLTFDINNNIYSIVNQSVDKENNDNYIYIFDIDVLNNTEYLYNKEQVVDLMLELRDIKNKIFFSNITDKVIELCN